MGVSMKKHQSIGQIRFVRKAAAAAVMAVCASGALAYEFTTDGGWTGTISTQVVASSSWRAQGQEAALIHHNDAFAAGLATPASLGIASGFAAGFGQGAINAPTATLIGSANAARASGFTGGNRGDTHNLNYASGDRYSTLFKFVTDLELKKGDTGALFRVKGWYDQAQNDEVVPYGAQSNRYRGARGSTVSTAATGANPFGSTAPATLSDESNDPLARFDGIALLDAYVYTSFDLGGKSMQVRVGNQAINWGESVFIQGVNQVSPLDITALRKAGAELKEGLLPIWAVSASVGLGGGVDIGGFYQIKWQNTIVDSCGTFWGNSESTIGVGGVQNCDMVTAFAGSAPSQFNNTLLPGGALVGGGAFATLTPGVQVQGYPKFGATVKPKDSGQYGLTLRFPVEAIDTEFGIYAMNIHARVPTAVGKNPTAAYIDAVNTQALAFRGGVAAQVQAGVTAATLAAGASAAVAAGTGAAAAAATILNGGTAFGAAGSYRQIGAGSGFSAQLAYPEDLKIFGVSAAFNVASWSIGVEASYQKDIPVSINSTDYIQALVAYAVTIANVAAGVTPFTAFTPVSAAAAQTTVRTAWAGGFGVAGLNTRAGPLSDRVAAAGLGGDLKGYDLYTKRQIQINGIKALPTDWADMFGAVSGVFVGEIGFQWNNVPEATGTTIRYGRTPMFGQAPSVLYNTNATAAVPVGAFGVAGGTPGVAGVPAYNNSVCNATNPQYDTAYRCSQDGFINDFAWGYRLRVAMDYPGTFGGWVMTPSFSWAHDINNSMDTQFVDGRKVAGLGVKFNLNKQHELNFGYQVFLKSKWDIFRDHDNVSASYSYTF